MLEKIYALILNGSLYGYRIVTDEKMFDIKREDWEKYYKGVMNVEPLNVINLNFSLVSDDDFKCKRRVEKVDDLRTIRGIATQYINMLNGKNSVSTSGSRISKNISSMTNVNYYNKIKSLKARYKALGINDKKLNRVLNNLFRTLDGLEECAITSFSLRDLDNFITGLECNSDNAMSEVAISVDDSNISGVKDVFSNANIYFELDYITLSSDLLSNRPSYIVGTYTFKTKDILDEFISYISSVSSNSAFYSEVCKRATMSKSFSGIKVRIHISSNWFKPCCISAIHKYFKIKTVVSNKGLNILLSKNLDDISLNKGIEKKSIKITSANLNYDLGALGNIRFTDGDALKSLVSYNEIKGFLKDYGYLDTLNKEGDYNIVELPNYSCLMYVLKYLTAKGSLVWND